MRTIFFTPLEYSTASGVIQWSNQKCSLFFLLHWITPLPGRHEFVVLTPQGVEAAESLRLSAGADAAQPCAEWTHWIWSDGVAVCRLTGPDSAVCSLEARKARADRGRIVAVP